MANNDIVRTSIQSPEHMIAVLKPYAKARGLSLSSFFVESTYERMMEHPDFRVWADNERKKQREGQATIIGKSPDRRRGPKPVAKKAVAKKR